MIVVAFDVDTPADLLEGEAELREAREGLVLVVDADRDVLVRRRELVRDLVVQGVYEAFGGQGS